MRNKTTLHSISRQDPGPQTRLLEAAIDIFGRYGYEGSTTRNIAQAAGVNIATIPYYFNSKEGLYRAVISHIVTMLKAHVLGSLKEINESSFTGRNSRQQAQGQLQRLLETLIGFMLGSPQAPRVARIILHEQLYPSSAYDVLFKGFMEPLLEALTTLISTVSGDPERRTAKLRAIAVVGQVFVFRMARETIIRSLDMEGYNNKEMKEIRQVVLDHTKSILSSFR
jgi:AcrR family transcriptional regulator